MEEAHQYRSAANEYDRDVVDTNCELERVAAPQGARTIVHRGPRQLKIVMPSQMSLIPQGKIFSIVFIVVVVVITLMALVVPLALGVYFGALVAIPILGFLIAVFFILRHLWSGSMLEIHQDRFRKSSVRPTWSSNCCNTRAPEGVAWRRLTRAPEIVTRAVASHNTTSEHILHDVAFIQLVEGVQIVEFGQGLTSLELEWLLEEIKEVVGPIDIP